MIPQLVITIELPELLDPEGGPRSRVNGVHNKAVKAAGKATLEHHQTRHLPNHFVSDARTKYHHRSRKPVTQVLKARRGRPNIDLLKTGRTRTKMTRRRPERLRASGSATGGRVRFTMRMRFPFPAVAYENPGGIKLKDMADELARWTKAEERESALVFRNKYVEQLRQRLKPRQRKRLASRVPGLGSP